MKNAIKWLLPRLPLPMLALAASYGVYQYALLFVPHWVAVIQASAFEVTYIGLAIMETGRAEQRKRATAISVGAVVVSVLYNSLAGFFHRNGLGTLPLAGEIILAALHGAPLAIVAYLVADLLLHNNAQEQEQEVGVEAEAIEARVTIEAPALQPALPNLVPVLQSDATPLQEEPQERESDLQPLASDLQKPDGVSEQAWQVWLLVRKQGKNQAEAAELLGKSISTISRCCTKVDEAHAKMKERVAA